MNERALLKVADKWMYPRMFLTRYSEEEALRVRPEFIEYMREQGITDETDEALIELFEYLRKHNPF